MTGLAEFALPPQRTMVQRAMDVGTRVLLPSLDLGDMLHDASSLPDVQPLTEYQQDPEGFFIHILGVHPRSIRWSLNEGYEDHAWDGTPDPLIAIMEGLRNWDDVGVEAGTGTQKSHTVAGLILWFLASWRESRAFTFAPTEKQLGAFIWMEIGRFWPRFQVVFPTAVLTDLRIRMRGLRDGAWGAQGFAVGRRAGEEVSVNAQGMHAEHMLLVYEETPGIEYAVIEAGENTATAPHNIRVAIGNPDHQLDTLHLFGHDQFGKDRPGIRNIRISALDHPNVVTGNPSIVPGAASVKSVQRRQSKYGEEGRLYQSRVRGISPAESADALIKLEWVRAAQARWLDETQHAVLKAGARALGVDVANSEDGDEGAIARGKGAYLEEVETFPCPNANNLGYRVYLEMKEDVIADEHVGVDGVGVGAGAVNELKGKDRWVQALGGGDSPFPQPGQEEQFNNLNSQMHWQMREDLRKGLIALPADDPELAKDLITRTWTTKNSKIVIQTKEELKKLLGRSPNKGDAAVYWNWVRDRAVPVSQVPKKQPTLAQRIWKEVEDMERLEREDDGSTREKYGSVLRQ